MRAYIHIKNIYKRLSYKCFVLFFNGGKALGPETVDGRKSLPKEALLKTASFYLVI